VPALRSRRPAHTRTWVRERLLGGLDHIGITLAHEDQIAAYERERERQGPVTTAAIREAPPTRRRRAAVAPPWRLPSPAIPLGGQELAQLGGELVRLAGLTVLAT
jgi:hypothetical protein